MSTYAKPEHHTVTVRTVTEDDWTDLDAVEFTCTAPEDGPCRTYPEHCECEVFTRDADNPNVDASGHPYVAGQDCWVKQWFDAVDAWDAPPYVGLDASDETDCGVPLAHKTGHVNIVGFDDGGPEWEWAS